MSEAPTGPRCAALRQQLATAALGLADQLLRPGSETFCVNEPNFDAVIVAQPAIIIC